MAKKKYIGIKRVWYTDVITEAVTAAKVKALLSTATEVKNVHQDTWGYEESDPETTEYINQLTGQRYYVDVEQGAIPTISFTMGEYSYLDKAALQGGTAIDASGNAVTDESTAVGWKRPETLDIITKAFIAQTKTGNYVVLTNAIVTGKGDMQDKNIGLGVSAAALENDGIGAEFWFDQSAVESESSTE